MTRGRLIRVKSESELRVGMIVVVKRCVGGCAENRCGLEHEGMVLGLDGGAWRGALSRYIRALRWTGFCSKASNLGRAIGLDAIPEGRLYRRDDDFEGEKEAQAQGRRDAKVKQREVAR